MKITKHSDIEYLIEFDETEVKALENVEDLFLVKPETVIRKSIVESLRKGLEGQDRFLSDLWSD